MSMLDNLLAIDLTMTAYQQQQQLRVKCRQQLRHVEHISEQDPFLGDRKPGEREKNPLVLLA